MSAETITVQGRAIRYETRVLNTDDLRYYSANPRIKYIVGRYQPHEITPDVIEGALLAMESTRELMADIDANGGLLEPVLVLGDLVVEGNTRLCAYRRLYSRTNEEKWRHIRAQVITDEVTEKELFIILGNFHIRGKSQWDPYEKAAYMQEMCDQGYTVREVATAAGIKSPSKVETMLKAYGAMTNCYLPKVQSGREASLDVRDEIKKYSYFEAMYQNRTLASRAEETPAFVEQFAQWVAEGRIPKAQDVRTLHTILDSKKARRAFIEEEPEDAYRSALYGLYVSQPHKVDAFYKRIKRFQDEIQEAEVMVVRQEVRDNPSKRTTIQKCFRVFRSFCKDIGLDCK